MCLRSCTCGLGVGLLDPLNAQGLVVDNHVAMLLRAGSPLTINPDGFAPCLQHIAAVLLLDEEVFFLLGQAVVLEVQGLVDAAVVEGTVGVGDEGTHLDLAAQQLDALGQEPRCEIALVGVGIQSQPPQLIEAALLGLFQPKSSLDGLASRHAMEDGDANQLATKEKAEVSAAAERAALLGEVVASGQEALAGLSIDVFD